jgi:hypothetical protein
MRAGTFAFAAIRLACDTIAAPLVTFESPCKCRANHGKRRWAVKNARGRFQRAMSRPCFRLALAGIRRQNGLRDSAFVGQPQVSKWI